MTAMRNEGRRKEVNDKRKSQQERIELGNLVDGFNEKDFYARGRTM